MAISRMQQPRQMYGLGSFVKKAVSKVTKPITKIAGKVVPKEIAGIMRTAAPFLPPGYREAAYLLGTAKQTGRISPMDLALTAAPTFFSKTDMGRGIAQRVGDFTLPGMETNLRDFTLGTPAEYEARIGSVTDKIPFSDMDGPGIMEKTSFFRDPKLTKEATSGILGEGGKMFQFGKAGSPKILDTKAGQFLLGGEDGKFSKAKLAGVGLTTLSLIQNSKTPQEAGEALVAQTGNSDDYERGVQLFSALPQGIFDIPEAYRLPVAAANGGLMRTNYAIGSEDPKPLPNDPTEPINPFRPKPIKPLGDMKMAEFSLQDYMDEFEKVFPDMIEKRGTQEYMDMLEDYFRGLASKDREGIMMAKEGGRANLALGTKPTPEESGLGGLPIEADMRYTGGFMPYGAVEKADDVPARLSKNEFVFTADAVRAAGGGSVNEGAKKMYTTMKQLEKKPEAKGMMA